MSFLPGITTKVMQEQSQIRFRANKKMSEYSQFQFYTPNKEENIMKLKKSWKSLANVISYQGSPNNS